MSNDPPPATAFAPAERAAPESLRDQTESFRSGSLTVRLLDALPSVLVILNGQRQIVYANRALQQWLAIDDLESLIGQRPGEVLSCDRSGSGPGGCGTHRECSTCGAALAILASQAGEPAVHECRINRELADGAEAIDLRVWATPLDHDGERFTVFALSDVSHEKRRRSLERLFFHDVLNTVGSIRGFAELLCTRHVEEREEVLELIRGTAEQIVEEIEAQRTLLAAEAGELGVRPAVLASRSFLEVCTDLYRGYEAARGRHVVVDPETVEAGLTTDPVLLRRILGNLVKNGLEAIPQGKTVTLGCATAGESGLEFRVHNPGAIPPEIQWQMFRRSFSTKGEGRGLGTYSVKLLTTLLGGETLLASGPETGTVVSIVLPRRLSAGDERENSCAAC